MCARVGIISSLVKWAQKRTIPKQHDQKCRRVTENANVARQWTTKPCGISLDPWHPSSARVNLQAQKLFLLLVYDQTKNTLNLCSHISSNSSWKTEILPTPIKRCLNRSYRGLNANKELSSGCFLIDRYEADMCNVWGQKCVQRLPNTLVTRWTSERILLVIEVK